MNTYSNFDGSLATIEVSNIAGETFIVQGLTVDADGGYDDTNAPVREIYMPGQPGGNSGAKITFSKRGNLAIASNVAGVAILECCRHRDGCGGVYRDGAGGAWRHGQHQSGRRALDGAHCRRRDQLDIGNQCADYGRRCTRGQHQHHG